MRSQESFEAQSALPNEDLIQLQKQDMGSSTLHQCVGALLHTDRQGRVRKGTGFLVSQDIVVTAAHNLYHQEGQYYFENLRFYPGLCGSSAGCVFYVPQQRKSQQTLFIPKQYLSGWNQKGQPRYDYAFVKLSHKVRLNSFVKLGLGFRDLTERLVICGYPYHHSIANFIDQQRGHFKAWQYQRGQYDRVLSSEQEISSHRKMRYRITTLRGQSGSPVVIDSLGRSIVVGVHCGGRRKGDPVNTYNYARVVNVGLVLNLMYWQHKNNCSPFKITDIASNTDILPDIEIVQDLRSVSVVEQMEKFEQLEPLLTDIAKDCFDFEREIQSTHDNPGKTAHNFVERVKSFTCSLMSQMASQFSQLFLCGDSEDSIKDYVNNKLRKIYGQVHSQMQVIQKKRQLMQVRQIKSLDDLPSDSQLYLESCPNLSQITLDVKALTIQQCEFLSKGNWPNLCHLSLANNRIGNDGCKYISRGHWISLQVCGLKGNDIGNVGCQYLSESQWPHLSHLMLEINNINIKGCESLCQADWPQLKRLVLQWNSILPQNKKIIRSLFTQPKLKIKFTVFD